MTAPLMSQERWHDFHGLQIRYDDRVLAPRDWTSAQSEWAAELLRQAPPGPVLELCAGVGHIGLLTTHLTFRSLVCVDADPVACEFLRDNALSAGQLVDVREGRMDAVLAPDERFALVIADPPWVERSRVEEFPEDPVTAIDGGDDGLDLVRECVRLIDRHLLPLGSAVLQVGPTQVEGVRGLLAGYADLRCVEVREYERGALVRIDRAGDTTS